MQNIKKKYEHIIPKTYNIPENVRLNYNLNYTIHTVYFINCLLNNNYLSWLENHINLINNYSNFIYIECVSNTKQRKIINNFIKKYKNIQINYYHINEHEYRGIKKVYDLGQIHNKDEDIILYFHSKGITKFNNFSETQNFDYNKFLLEINRVKEIFDIFPNINKIGLMSAQPGWIWYNFWFVRGKYIFHVEKPLIINDRYYYESWLYKTKKFKKYDCYSIVPSYYNHFNCPNIKSYYIPVNNIFVYKDKNMFEYIHN